MYLIDKKAKQIMEECKARARAAGLIIHGETLEYIVTNQDMIELSPKIMIPTLYDYWVHDVEVLRDKWLYDVYPHNPFETTINTRPGISFYNDNNPDWLNAMIFYHVLGHLDMDMNNIFFRATWKDDFCGQALADKRLINRIREELGSEKRWVDYVIEFARAADNLVGYYAELEEADALEMQRASGTFSEKSSFYFGEFLRRKHDDNSIALRVYYEEVERYSECIRRLGEKLGEAVFFSDEKTRSKFPEFDSTFKKRETQKRKRVPTGDILLYLMENSEFLDREENLWMKDVIAVVRRTSLYFQPQIRTKICHEGWASLWHERLFMTDERLNGHEINFSVVNSGVMLHPRVGSNPYIIGKLLFEFIEELARKGKLSYAYQLIQDAETRNHYDQALGEEYGKKVLFEARRNLNDHMLINFLSDDDFQDFVNRHNLFVAGMRLTLESIAHGSAEVYVKSKSGRDYRAQLNRLLYHPPYVVIDESKATKPGGIYLNHVYEGRSLVTRYIAPVLIGLSYFTGGKAVKLETTEFEIDRGDHYVYQAPVASGQPNSTVKKDRVLYTCEGKKITRTVLSKG
ncbi:MAG: SpoVR family protein [Candidatus Spechtbacteria bacterium]|nr:SpoVR family protein [Candidatus Spechtbacteria bacterium]